MNELAHEKGQYFVICGLPSQLSWLPFGEYYHDIVSKNGSMYYDHLQCTSITAKDTEYIVVRSQKYSRLRCLLRVTGLVICFYLGWSGSILQFRQNIIKVGSKSWLLTCSSNITLSLPSYTCSALKRELNFCNGYRKSAVFLVKMVHYLICYILR